MKTAICCLILGVLAAIRGVADGVWNLEHTAAGFLGYRPLHLLLTFAIAALGLFAGVHLLVRERRRRP